MATKRPSSLLRTLRLIALVATLPGSFKLVSTVIFLNNAFPAQGIILDYAQADEAFAPDSTPIIAFINYRDQKVFGTPQSALGTSATFLGQKVPILYQPDNAQNFRLDTLMGLWGSSVISLLYGLLPFLLFNTLIGASNEGARTRTRRKSTLGVKHLLDHTQNLSDTDRPVVRRMR
ncbi:MAG TPA: hypothetical protein EYG79_12955 [Rhodobacteraceae bacterium]|nr:hypothetical protein [Paracoccaceae bacterium]